MANNPPHTHKWILPPQLNKQFAKFITLYDTVFKESEKRRPLIIHGAPGVGKSLFTYAFETMLIRDNQDLKEGKRINISAIPSTLIESELFGAERGAFTGSIKKKIGLLESEEMVVLEEIGELTKEVQAKLLTFLEDGIYYSVGNEKPKHAKDIQIIATTNAPLDNEHFRQDFLDRCYTFHVPSLHERRGDILYMLAYQYPNCFRQMLPWQILRILAYQWPGNMRELEKFGTTALSDNFAVDRFGRLDLVKGTTVYCHGNFFDPYLCKNAERMIKNIGLETEEIESLLNQANMSMQLRGAYSEQDYYARPVFKEFDHIAIVTKKDFPQIGILEEMESFKKTYNGICFFARFFWIRSDADINLLDVGFIREEYRDTSGMGDPYHLISYYGLDGNVGEIIDTADTYMKNMFTNENVLESESAPSDPFTVTEEEYLKSYYRELLSRYGKVKEVARRSGINRKTLDSKLIRMGIHPQRQK